MSAVIAPHLEYRSTFLPKLAEAIPGILQSQDQETGRFGSGVWIVRDQEAIFPLAAAWATPGSAFYHSPDVLEAILRGGDPLIDAQDERGMWVFRTKDNSVWGDIYMPWTYSRWVRAYALIRDADIAPERRERWETALKLGYAGISEKEMAKPVQNIPAHHAMGLHVASGLFDRPDWQESATAYLHKVAAEQDSAGFWSEHSGPVVGYNYVYVDAFSAYTALSGDRSFVPNLQRAAQFHAAATYPNGCAVETIDERQIYSREMMMAISGFSYSDLGRGYTAEMWETVKATRNGWVVPDRLADLVLYGQDGPTEPTTAGQAKGEAVLGAGDAVFRRDAPWFVALSAYCAPLSPSRWIQDRQNLVSVFHDATGLIVGGGNTKLQPLWSTFTVGDISVLRHTPGDENPNFLPPDGGLTHVPADARLTADRSGLELTYRTGDVAVRCRVAVVVEGRDRIRLVYEARPPLPDGLPVAAHVPLVVQPEQAWTTASGASGTFTDAALHLGSDEAGGAFSTGGWTISIPEGATIMWPVRPHNPYAKNGSAPLTSARAALTLPPFTPERLRQEVVLTVGGS